MPDLPDIYYRLFAGMTEYLSSQGVKYAVLCPGSRSAPLALSFMRQGKIRHFIISDERSAAYIALGLSLHSGTTVVLVSTSGTAALNFIPAVAEAFNQKASLLVITADRPEIYIDRGENQTIRQKGIFSPNIVAGHQLDPLASDNMPERFMAEIQGVFADCRYGPVHLNIPLSEPLYSSRKFTASPPAHSAVREKYPFQPSDELAGIFRDSKRILVVPGMMQPEAGRGQSLKAFSLHFHVPVIYDITANLLPSENLIHHVDLILDHSNDPEHLLPDLLITLGKFTVSKKMKEFLRSRKLKNHWHISEDGGPVDTYFSLSGVVKASPEDFFNTAITVFQGDSAQRKYLGAWRNACQGIEDFLQQKISVNPELALIRNILSHVDSDSVLHLGNSMVVRYANEAGFPGGTAVRVFSNRGTSGIDGSVSTAVGAALDSDKKKIFC